MPNASYVGSAQASAVSTTTLVIPYVASSGTKMILGAIAQQSVGGISTITDDGGNTWTFNDFSSQLTPSLENPTPVGGYEFEFWFTQSGHPTTAITIVYSGSSTTINAVVGEYANLSLGKFSVVHDNHDPSQTEISHTDTPTSAVGIFVTICASALTGPDIGGTERQKIGPNSAGAVIGLVDDMTGAGIVSETTGTPAVAFSIYGFGSAFTPADGNIVIQKVTVPGGSAQSFDFTSDYGSPFSLTDGQSNDSGPLAAGTYSVAETPVVGWNTTTDSDPTNIVVTAGNTTTVTFTNTEQHIITTKATVPGGSGQAFLFTPSWGAPFTLLDGQSNDSGPLNVGTYSIVETPVASWVTTVSQDPTAIVIGAGDTVTISFTNTFNPTPPPTPCADSTGCPFTLADAQSTLGARLYDPTHQFWSLPELTAYIVEALRTWNALASYWRDEFTFPSQQGVVWYDITDTTVAPNTLRPITVTDQQLMEVIEYHLLEPITDTFPLTWTGSQQFSVADLQQALQRRRDETLSVTGCFITRLLLPAVPGKIPLPNRATELRRVAFMPADGFDFAATPMFQDDIWALQAFRPQFTTDAAGIPDTYVISTEPIRPSTLGPTITFLPNVPPGVPGQFEVLVLMSGIALCATGPSLVTVPDDWTWVLKWGAMADLLGRESNAKDSLRAKYCEARYKQGLALLSVAPALLTMRWNNLPLQIDAVKAADEYRPNWEGGTQAVPDSVVTAGMNLLGLAPPPTATGVTMTADVIRNAPVPVLGTDCIMVTRDVYDVVLDYAAHLAAFKQGGEEFTRSIPLMTHFMEAAALSSSRLGEQGEFQKILWQRSQLEDALNPRYSTPTPEGDNG